MGKQLTPAVYVLTLLHHPHRIVGTVGNTADTSPDAHTPAERARQAHDAHMPAERAR
ncbi:hypothetical protein [Phormidium nigroviride]|nr:hypothetical protein [Oscillatoria nigro-viridis]